MVAALIVVDAQKGFVGPSTEHAIPNIIRLVRAWHGPVLFTRNFNYPGSPLETLAEYRQMYGPPETDLLDELSEFAHEIHDKHTYSIFNEAITPLVRDRGWKTLVFCGFDTEACVLKSATDAFDMGLRPVIVADAVASSYGLEKHEAGLTVAEAVLGPKPLMTVDELLVSQGA